MNNKLSEKESANISEQLKNIATQIHETSDPEALESYRKIIRKSLPLSTRKYLSAFLFFNCDKEFEYQSSSKSITKKPAKSNKTINSTIPTKTIFISIGKNRKVYPKDLIKLFAKTLDIPTELFGQVKIFPNYSFIDVPTKQCKKAIKILDGSEFRKAKITVNFSKTQSV